jgi:hypothetical protein
MAVARASMPLGCSSSVGQVRVVPPNMLVFWPLTGPPRRAGQAVRDYLAWKSVKPGTDPQPGCLQANQARTKREQAGDGGAASPRTCQWLLVPGQADPQAPLEWRKSACKAGMPWRCVPVNSRTMGFDRPVRWDTAGWSWTGCHSGVASMASNSLPRTLPSICTCHAAGCRRTPGRHPRRRRAPHMAAETFAYANGWDTEQQRYVGCGPGDRQHPARRRASGEARGWQHDN